jgi:hypothetical protein
MDANIEQLIQGLVNVYGNEQNWSYKRMQEVSIFAIRRNILDYIKNWYPVSQNGMPYINDLIAKCVKNYTPCKDRAP